MATVYLAQDLRHNRRVAVKVLRPELAAVIGADRFLTEITTTANLQHPHILPLFDSGEAGGFLFYVMPFIDGETVRNRLDREKQLPIGDAVRIASEVAAALDYAHRRNIIHRDIKPENILLHDGSALVADFGIALAASKAGGTRMTETGMSLGTPHYMSPEQAMGEREITARSDVYALGCVTYEMLTGDPPFTGSTAQAIVARVVTESPRPMAPQRHTIPSHVEAAVLTALEKLPADRFATAAGFAAALADRGYGPHPTLVPPPAAAQPARPVRSRALVPALAASAVLLAALAAWGWLRPEPRRPVLRFSMGLPPEQSMRQGVIGVSLDLSPDGKRMVYLGPGEGGDQLWIRDRDRLDASPLPGTTAALNPFFSPDGNRIGFSAGPNFDLKVVPATGGPPITLTRAGPGSGGGGAWGSDGWIYFDSPRGIARIRAEGGDPEPVALLDSTIREIGHAWPAVLPNGKGILYRSRRSLDPATFDIVALDLATRERHVLTRGLMGRYVAPGYLVFVRADGAVLAAPFDQDRFELTGPAVALFDGVMSKPLGSVDFAIAANGTLAYVPGVASAVGGSAELVYVDRAGAVTSFDPPLAFNPSANRALSLSPDGTRLALDVLGTEGSNIWVKHLPAGPFSRLTFGGISSLRPRWTPDGLSVVYAWTPDSGLSLVRKQRSDGSAGAETIWQARGTAITEASVSPDGEWLLYRVIKTDGNRDVFGVRPGRDSVATPLLATRFQEQGAAVSPNGRWIAYMSDESGQDDIFVRPFPGTDAGRWQISTRGGSAPRWSHSGRELFFESASGDMMVAPVTTGATFSSGEPRRLFPLGGAFFNSIVVPYYDLTPDDRRFVMVRFAAVAQAPGAGQLVLVENWFEELRAKMQSKDR